LVEGGPADPERAAPGGTSVRAAQRPTTKHFGGARVEAPRRETALHQDCEAQVRGGEGLRFDIEPGDAALPLARSEGWSATFF